MKTYHIPTKVEEVTSVSVPTSSEKEAPNSNNSNSIGSNYLNYIIKSGDTLSDIARKYNTTVEELARLNGISNANAISVGKALKIPQHTIGHFQVVRPTRGNDAYSYNTGVYVARAEGSNFDYKTASSVYGQGKAMDKIKYYTHK